MDLISLEAARRAGFEPQTYSLFHQHKKTGQMNLSTTEKYLHELDVARGIVTLLGDDPETVLEQNRTQNRTAND